MNVSWGRHQTQTTGCYEGPSGKLETFRVRTQHTPLTPLILDYCHIRLTPVITHWPGQKGPLSRKTSCDWMQAMKTKSVTDTHRELPWRWSNPSDGDTSGAIKYHSSDGGQNRVREEGSAQTVAENKEPILAVSSCYCRSSLPYLCSLGVCFPLKTKMRCVYF